MLTVSQELWTGPQLSLLIDINVELTNPLPLLIDATVVTKVDLPVSTPVATLRTSEAGRPPPVTNILSGNTLF